MASRSPWLPALVLLTAGGAERAAAQDSVLYTVSSESRFDVHTGRAGLLGALGHEHRVRARAFQGQIVHVPRHPERSFVRITIRSDSLEILTDAQPSDVAKMRRAMREETLRVRHFPEITFTSRQVELLGDDSLGTRLRVSGDFTMTGRTRPVAADVRVHIARDTLRAAGGFSLKQTEFGIEPYSAALGTVKVADRVDFEFDLVAVSGPPQ